jgi:hypothetical protein
VITPQRLCLLGGDSSPRTPPLRPGGTAAAEHPAGEAGLVASPLESRAALIDSVRNGVAWIRPPLRIAAGERFPPVPNEGDLA